MSGENQRTMEPENQAGRRPASRCCWAWQLPGAFLAAG